MNITETLLLGLGTCLVPRTFYIWPGYFESAVYGFLNRATKLFFLKCTNIQLLQFGFYMLALARGMKP